MTDLILGIDLGTTNSLAAFVGEQGAEVVENEDHSTQVPSVVTLVDQTHTLIGNVALAARIEQPKTTFYSFKRFMGRGLADVDEDLSKLPFLIEPGERDNLELVTPLRRVSPEQMSSFILAEIKQQAEAVLGQPVSKVVITVPAHFDDPQRQATRDAAELAGLDPVRILNEPTAAAIAYGLEEKAQGKVLIYDFGGGTFDVSILELKNKLFKVIATEGDTHLGGDDMDHLLVESLVKKLGLKNELSAQSKQGLKQVAERIKMDLTLSLTSNQRVVLAEANINQEVCFSRAEFDLAIGPLVDQTLAKVDLALKEANLSPGEIKDVVLVGGSTRVPLVRRKVSETFGQPPHLNLNPDQVVALGAAIQGHLLSGGRRDFLLMDVVPLSLGLETLGGTFSKLLIKNASIPARAKEIFSTSVDNQTGIDLNIYQGEREFVKDCRLLGNFKLSGFPAMPAGLPQVEVSFFVDQNGLLNVTAKELRSDVTAQIDLVPAHGLKRSEVSQMIRDSYERAQEDFEQRNLVEFRAKAASIEAGLTKVWSQAPDFLTSAEIEAIAAHRKDLAQVAQGADPVALKVAIDKMGDLTRDFADSIMGSAAKGVISGE